MSSFITTIFLLLVGSAALLASGYNTLRKQSETVKRAKADVFAVLQKRRTLAQKLADIAASYGDHEKLAHLTVSELSSGRRNDRSAGEVINDVRALAMDFPDLKANQTYQQLMTQLDTIEGDVLNRRETYNRVTELYNSTRTALPHVLYASAIGFPEAPYFTMEDEDGVGIAEFSTDDGKLLKEGMARIGGRIAAATTIRDQLPPLVDREVPKAAANDAVSAPKPACAVEAAPIAPTSDSSNPTA